MGRIVSVVLVFIIFVIGIGYLLTKPSNDAKDKNTVADSSNESEIQTYERRELPPIESDIANNYSLSGDLPKLDDSDSVLANHLRLIITPIRLQLLSKEQLIRKFVLQVDNAARGDVVFAHSPFIQPPRGIEVKPVESEEASEGAIVIDPESYARYEPYADLAEAVDVSLLLAYYQFYEPLFDEAYAELGYPDSNFRPSLIEAIDQLLSAPVIEGDISLIQPEINYEFADPALESLNELQKQLVRMGPENTQRIQAVLQQFKARIQ